MLHNIEREYLTRVHVLLVIRHNLTKTILLRTNSMQYGADYCACSEYEWVNMWLI